MNQIVITSIIPVLILFVFGGLVFKRGMNRRLSHWFLFFALTGGLWQVATLVASLFISDQITIFANRLTFVFGFLSIIAFYGMSRAYLGEIKPFSRLGKLRLWIFAVVYSVILLTDQVVEGYQNQNGFLVDQRGRFYWSFVIILFAVLIPSVKNLIRAMDTVENVKKIQIKVMLTTYALGITLVVLTNLVLPSFVSEGWVSQIGLFVMAGMVIVNSYVILRNKIFDLKLIFSQSFAFTLAVLVLALIYSFFASYYLGGLIGLDHKLTSVERLAFIPIIIILAILFQPMLKLFERATYKWFYQYHYYPSQLISEVSRILARDLKIEEMIKDTAKIIVSGMGIDNIQVIVYEHNRIAFSYATDYKIFNTKNWHYLKDEVIFVDHILDTATLYQLKSQGAELIFPMILKGKLIGHIILGRKKGGDIYTDGDYQTIEIVAGDLAIALDNAKVNYRLKDTLEKLRALDKSKDEFISIASHQLRTPLTTIRGYSEMLADQEFGKISLEQKNILNQINQAGQNMNQLLEDLLATSRLAQGRLVINKTEFDFANLVREEYHYRQNSLKKDLELKLDLPDSIELFADQGKLRQVVINLIDNAIQYTDRGSILVRAEVISGSKVIKMPVHGSDNIAPRRKYLSFQVIDTGIGVPISKQKQLFSKFYRASNAKIIRPDGNGLGVYLVREIARIHHGNVIFQSPVELNQGSVFGIWIPYTSSRGNNG
ncbi:hypothetical protein KA531_01020 [Candidatus Saccharibacteria bacterium]|nr:hypothetical protein [Candidatus Saccharibacteria bacterium]